MFPNESYLKIILRIFHFTLNCYSNLPNALSPAVSQPADAALDARYIVASVCTCACRCTAPADACRCIVPPVDACACQCIAPVNGALRLSMHAPSVHALVYGLRLSMHTPVCACACLCICMPMHCICLCMCISMNFVCLYMCPSMH